MKTGARYSILSFLFLITVIGFSIPAILHSAGQEESETPSEDASARRAKPLRIPASARDRKNPVPAVADAIASGRSLFKNQCAMCHGSNGDGRGDLAVRLKMRVPDLRDPKLQAKRTDGDLFYILTEGHSDMPPEKRLPDQSKWEMIHFMRTLRSGGATGG